MASDYRTGARLAPAPNTASIFCNDDPLEPILGRQHARRLAMSTNQTDLNRIQVAVATSLHAHWLFFLIEGIILLALGLAAIVLPPIATIAVEIIIGWLLLVSGIVGVITTFRMRHVAGFWWSLVS